MSVPMMVRKLYMRAERVTDSGALRLERLSGPVPVKSNVAEPSSLLISIFRRMTVPSSGDHKQSHPMIAATHPCSPLQ